MESNELFVEFGVFAKCVAFGFCSFLANASL